jgi:sugar O-acyltransferase (sialic acid O-acetyltransferase NeuD family)
MDLVIVGAGGHGREVLDIIEALAGDGQELHFVGFVADTVPDPELLERRGARHVGPVDLLAELDALYTLGVGDSGARHSLDERLSTWGRSAATLVHPAATLGSDVELGPGVQLATGARVTTNVRLGRHVHLNVNAVVSHDCRVGDYATLSPGVHVNGNVTVGEGVFLGTGAIVTPGVTIGNGARIGAGAVVLDDIPAGVTAVGIPARW